MKLNKDNYDNVEAAQHEYCCNHCNVELHECPMRHDATFDYCKAVENPKCLRKTMAWLFSPARIPYHVKYVLNGEIHFDMVPATSFEEVLKEEASWHRNDNFEILQISKEPISRSKE